MRNMISVIMGGGKGTRLSPLTEYRSKPAVPLAGKYRLIDVPISNSINLFSALLRVNIGASSGVPLIMRDSRR